MQDNKKDSFTTAAFTLDADGIPLLTIGTIEDKSAGKVIYKMIWKDPERESYADEMFARFTAFLQSP